MSATKRLPLLLDDDLLSLAPGFTVRHGAVCDVQLATLHQLHGPGEHIANALVRKVRYGRLRAIARQYTIPAASLNDLLYFLHVIGALVRQRPAIFRLKGACIAVRHYAIGGAFAAPRRRFPTTFLGISRAIMRACSTLIICTAITTLLVAGSGIFSISTVAHCAVLGVVVFVSSLVFHEYCHLRLIRTAGARHGLLQYGLHVALLHKQLSPRQELSIALAGPLAGLLWSIAVAGWAWGTGYPLYAGICMTVGLFHTLSLMPWTADGTIVYSAWRTIRRRQA